MNRICIVFGRDGLRVLVSDEPVRCFTICDHIPGDRVYELSPTVGVLEFGSERVRAVLRDGPIGRADYNPPEPRAGGS